MKSSVSIVLFLLLSGFFLSALLGAVEHSRKLLAIAGGCLAAVVCVIVFLTPVELPSWRFGQGDGPTPATGGSPLDSTTVGVTSTITSTVTSTFISPVGSTAVSPVTSTVASPITSAVSPETPGAQ